MESVVQPVQSLPGTLGQYKSNRILSLAIIVLLAVHAALSLVLAFSWPAISGVLGGDDVQGVGLALAAMAIGSAAVIQGLIFLATAICFLVWLHKSFANLPALGSESVVFSPKSAVVGWFIPFVNLVQGYKSVHTLYLESQPRPATLPSGFALPRSAPIVGLWWGFYLARGVFSRIANNSSSTTWLVANELFDIVAAALCIAIVYRIEKRQHDQYDDLVRRVPQPVPTDRLR